jgi:hypothetical protein
MTEETTPAARPCGAIAAAVAFGITSPCPNM